RCETGSNPLETRGKRKPVTPENDPRETGCLFSNGGGGGSRTRDLLLIFNVPGGTAPQMHHRLFNINGWQ
ncbi:MAG: hypothetical protein RBR09_13825, partial [Desulfobulbaceae bacterium]|nr:hypothetical protein [Desulfobulbaceae bacterium]